MCIIFAKWTLQLIKAIGWTHPPLNWVHPIAMILHKCFALLLFCFYLRFIFNLLVASVECPRIICNNDSLKWIIFQSRPFHIKIYLHFLFF